MIRELERPNETGLFSSNVLIAELSQQTQAIQPVGNHQGAVQPASKKAADTQLAAELVGNVPASTSLPSSPSSDTFLGWGVLMTFLLVATAFMRSLR